MSEVECMTQEMLKKTNIVSIRMDSNLSNKLHEKSAEQKVSLNTLINNMLEKQVHWYDLTNEIGWVNVFRTTFKQLKLVRLLEKKIFKTLSISFMEK